MAESGKVLVFSHRGKEGYQEIVAELRKNQIEGVRIVREDEEMWFVTVSVPEGRERAYANTIIKKLNALKLLWVGAYPLPGR